MRVRTILSILSLSCVVTTPSIWSRALMKWGTVGATPSHTFYLDMNTLSSSNSSTAASSASSTANWTRRRVFPVTAAAAAGVIFLGLVLLAVLGFSLTGSNADPVASASAASNGLSSVSDIEAELGIIRQRLSDVESETDYLFEEIGNVAVNEETLGPIPHEQVTAPTCAQHSRKRPPPRKLNAMWIFSPDDGDCKSAAESQWEQGPRIKTFRSLR